jgi:hypothetical protein
LKKAAAALKRAAEDFAALAAHADLKAAPELADIINDIDSARETVDEAEEAILPALMDSNLQLVKGWVKELADVGYPTLGTDFFKHYAQAGLRLQLNPKLGSTASYCSFSLAKENHGFVNTITFGKFAAHKPYHLYNAYLHETLHGFQKRACGALQASPFNEIPMPLKIRSASGEEYEEDVSIIICPEDWLVLQEKCEQDAYAKQAWLNSLLAQREPKAVDASNKSAVSVEYFRDCLAQAGGNLAQALHKAAIKASATKFYVDKHGNPSNGPYSFAHNWHDIALRDYLNAINARRNSGTTNFVFVRISPEDVHAIGAAFGPNPFGDDPHDPALVTRTESLKSAENQNFAGSGEKRLKALNAELGIKKYEALPTLRDYLARHNTTIEQFMANTTKKAVIQPTAPKLPAPPQP